MSGPLKGVRVVEMVGIGPGPFCGMMLADMGADVVRVERAAGSAAGIGGAIAEAATRADVNARGKRTIVVDLKTPEGVEQVLALVAQADALIEGFRPGVMERLGLGPDTCLARNPKLVFGRMTGWGQNGPLAQAAGHDLNYIAITGMLAAMGPADGPPLPPLNLVGDFGGGAMMLAFGIACALMEARDSGRGQVVDAAMSDGAALLGSMIYGLKAGGVWSARRGSNFLDGAAHFYGAYRCADGKDLTIGSIEPQFYAQLLELLDLSDDADFKRQWDNRAWPLLRKRLEAIFLSRTRAEWCALMEGTDVCFAPVLDMDEAPCHPHNVARGTFIEIDGIAQPAPAPRFSRTPAEVQCPADRVTDVQTVLTSWLRRTGT